jgi:hypothetical protein
MCSCQFVFVNFISIEYPLWNLAYRAIAKSAKWLYRALTVQLMDCTHAIEEALGKKAQLNLMEMQPIDVPATSADVDDLSRDAGFRPTNPIVEGVRRFLEW